MQKHIKVYLQKFWEWWICEVCNERQIVDIHHIQERSKFGKKTKHLQDDISNLIWLCRTCHEQAHWIGWKLDKWYLHLIHYNNLWK
jgi:hypothetical protein